MCIASLTVTGIVHTIHVAQQVQTTSARDTSSSLRSRKLTRDDGVPQFPKKMVCQLSYQVKGRASEGTSFSGFFGIIDIVGFHICSPEELFGTTAHSFLNPHFLNLANDSADGIPNIYTAL